MWYLGGVTVTSLGFLAARYHRTDSLGGLRPTLGVMSLAEAQAFLNGGVVGVDRLHFCTGTKSVAQGLIDGELKYIQRDPREKWMSANEIWAAKGGDCEDLASAVVAELQLKGYRKALVDIIKGGGTVAHAVSKTGLGYFIDPSVIGGMYSRRTSRAIEIKALKGLL